MGKLHAQLLKWWPSDERGFQILHRFILAWAVLAGFSYDIFAKTINIGGSSFNLILAVTALLTIVSTVYLLVRRKYRLLKSKMLASLALLAGLAGLSALIYWTRWYQMLFSAEFSPALWLVVLLLAWNLANLYDSIKLAAQVLFAGLASFALGTFVSAAIMYLNVSGRLSFPDLSSNSHTILANLGLVAVGFILVAFFVLLAQPRKVNQRWLGVAALVLGVLVLSLTLSLNTLALLIFALLALMLVAPERQTIIYALGVTLIVVIINTIAINIPAINQRWANLQLQPVADLATTVSVTREAINASNPFWGASSRPFSQLFLQFQPVNNGTQALPAYSYAFADIWQLIANFGLLILIPLGLFAYYFIKRSAQNLSSHNLWLNRLVLVVGVLVIGAIFFSHVSMQLWAVFAIAVAICANFEATEYWRIKGRGLLAKIIAIVLSLFLIVYLVSYIGVSLAGNIYGFTYQRLQIGNALSEQAALNRIEFVSKLDPNQSSYHMDLAKLYASILVDNLNQRSTPAKLEELAAPLNSIWQQAVSAVQTDPLNYLNWDTRLSVLDLSVKLAPQATNYSPLFSEAISQLQALAPRDPTKMMLLAQFVSDYNHQIALDIAQRAYLANPNILALQFDYAKLLIAIDNKAEAQKMLQGFLNNNSLTTDSRAQAQKLLDGLVAK